MQNNISCDILFYWLGLLFAELTQTLETLLLFLCRPYGSQAKEHRHLKWEVDLHGVLTAVGQAGFERGLAIGGARCCGCFHAATALWCDCSVQQLEV